MHSQLPAIHSHNIMQSVSLFTIVHRSWSSAILHVSRTEKYFLSHFPLNSRHSKQLPRLPFHLSYLQPSCVRQTREAQQVYHDVTRQAVLVTVFLVCLVAYTLHNYNQ